VACNRMVFWKRGEFTKACQISGILKSPMLLHHVLGISFFFIKSLLFYHPHVTLRAST
jgi:hypothetical protein